MPFAVRKFGSPASIRKPYGICMLNLSLNGSRTTYRFECRNNCLPVIRCIVIYRYTFVRSQPQIGHLWHSLESSIACPEINICSPVVREVLGEGTACARGLIDRIVSDGGHRSIERITTNYLVEMWGRSDAWVDKRI